jgi:hypothetical protein
MTAGEPHTRTLLQYAIRPVREGMNNMPEGIHGGRPHRRSGWFGMVVGVGVILIVLGVWFAVDGLGAPSSP